MKGYKEEGEKAQGRKEICICYEHEVARFLGNCLSLGGEVSQGGRARAFCEVPRVHKDPWLSQNSLSEKR
jgi:hypothetical protein